MKTGLTARQVRIKTIDGDTIRGKINLESDFEHVRRLSDLFIKGKNPAIVLFSAQTMGPDKVAIINKRNIIWVEDEEPLKPEEADLVKIEPMSKGVRIKTVDGTLIRGKVNLLSESEPIERLSDLFIKGKNPFIVVYDIRAMGSVSAMLVNRDNIVWASPD